MGKDQRGNDDDTVVLAKMLEDQRQILNPEKGLGFPGGSDSKAPACNVGDLGSNPGLGRSPGEGKDYPFQYSGLENSMGSQRVEHD